MKKELVLRLELSLFAEEKYLTTYLDGHITKAYEREYEIFSCIANKVASLNCSESEILAVIEYMIDGIDFKNILKSVNGDRLKLIIRSLSEKFSVDS